MRRALVMFVAAGVAAGFAAGFAAGCKWESGYDHLDARGPTQRPDGASTMHDDAAVLDYEAGVPGDAFDPRVTVVTSPGSRVYFETPQSQLVAAGFADRAGIVRSAVDAGGIVTAVVEGTRGASSQLYTFFDVQPGDRLYANTSADRSDGMFLLLAPADPFAAFATVDTSCASFDNALGSIPRCVGPMDLIVATRDDNGTYQHYAVREGIEPPDGGTLSVATLEAVVGFTAELTGLGGVGALDITSAMRTPANAIGMTSFFQKDLAGAAATTTFSALTGLGAQAGQVSQIRADDWTLIDWQPYAAHLSIDTLAPRLHPLATDAVFDPATRTLAWTERLSAGRDASSMRVVITSRRGAAQWDWHVSAPHATSLTLPQLPVDTFDFNIRADDLAFAQELTRLSAPYAIARPLLLEVTQDPRRMVTGYRGQIALRSGLAASPP